MQELKRRRGREAPPDSWIRMTFPTGMIEIGKCSDEELNAVIKEYVEKRSRDEAAQAHMTVKPVDTVQHCSPCSPSPDMPSGVYFGLENTEGEMGPELDELKSPSPGTGLKTPGQQCPPNEGIWETGRTTASGILTARAGPSQGENISSPTEREKSTTTVADISSKAATPSKRRHNTSANRTSSSTPVGEERRHRLGMRLYLYFIFLGRAGRLLFVFVFSVSALCVSVSQFIFIFPGDHFSEKLKDMRGDAGRVDEVRNRRASIFPPITLLKMARTSNARSGRSANALR